LALERASPKTAEDGWLLSQVWLQRFASGSLFHSADQDTETRVQGASPFAWDNWSARRLSITIPAERRDFGECAHNRARADC